MLAVLNCVPRTMRSWTVVLTDCVLPTPRHALWLVLAFLPASLTAGDWASYLNGRDRAAFTDAKLPAELKPAWVYRTPARPEKAWSGPRTAPIEGHEMRHRVAFDSSMQVVIQDDRVFFGSTVDNNVYCVDAHTGQTIWKFPTDGPVRLAPTLAHDNVYFGSDDGHVYCVRQQTGKTVWQMRIGPKDDRLLARGEMISRWPVRTGVLIDGDIAYFGAGVFPHELIYMLAVEAKSGKVIWRNDTISQQNAGRNDLSPQGYLLANDSTLFVPSGRSLPVALSRETGDIVFQRKYSWRTDAGGVVGGTKALLGDGQVYAGGPHHFLAMDEGTGAVGESYIGGRQMVLADDLAYLMDGEKVFCVDREEHARASQEKQKWFLRARSDRRDPKKYATAKEKIKEYAGVGIIWEVPCEFDDALIATGDYLIAGGLNEVWMLNRQDGSVVWKSEVTGNVTGLAATESLLTVSTEPGHIYAFRKDVEDSSLREWPVAAIDPFDDAEQQQFAKAAADILKLSQQTTGFCLIVGSEDGRLATELARQSDLTIFAVEDDPARVSASRTALEAAGLHGSRVTVVECSENQIPFSNYFANLIVSESQIRTGTMPVDVESVARFLKPCGGVAMLSDSAGNGNASSDWTAEMVRTVPGEATSTGAWNSFRRGQLPGAGAWSHQYGNVANTSLSDDARVRDGLGVLWYGDPGPSSMINRHEAAGAPLSTNGRMFIQGVDSVMAYDAYNGNFLWEHDNPGAIRTGVFNNRETHNLAASDDALFVAVEDKCTELDGATGDVVAEFQIPASPDGIDRAWAYVAYDQQQLFGTSTIREELEARLRRRGLTVKTQTDAVFAFDTKTKKLAWVYRGSNILHTTIAVGPDHVYFIDSSITPAERQELYRRDKGELKKLTGEAAAKAEAEMKSLDVRMAVAVDRKTGKKVWERPVNVTDTTNVSAGGGSLTVMYADGYLVLCGANANGHYWRQFLSGEFEKRKLLVLDADTGDELWSKNANYMNRPAVIGGEIFAEPWAFNLATGEPRKRPHPTTGEDSDWRFSRPGHHCGVITATPNMMFFRSGFIGYYDLYNDSGTKHFAGQRLGCWVNAIPGNGLVMIPEASAGCVCQFSIASTVVLEPKTESKSWGIFSAVGSSTPVRRLAVNLGAPGDHMDDSRREWFGFPRPSSRGRLEYVFDIAAKFADGGGWFSRNQSNPAFAACEQPWLYASGARGLAHFEVDLLSKGDPSATYSVMLHMSEISTDDAEKVIVKVGGTEGRLQAAERKLGEVNGQSVVTVTFEADVTTRLVVDVDYSKLTELPTVCGVEFHRHEAVAQSTEQAGGND